MATHPPEPVLTGITSDPLQDIRAPFAGWCFDDGTEIVSRAISIVDGIPVCVEQWRFDQTVGESIIVPLDALPDLDDAGMFTWVSDRLTVHDDHIAGREGSFFAVHHGFIRV